MTSNSKNTAIGLSLLSGMTGIFSTVINIPIKLFIFGMLGPFNYGLVRIFSLVDSYTTYGELGSRFGLSRQIPSLLGNGDNKHAKSIADIALSWITIISFLGIFILWAVFYNGYTFEGLLTRNRLVLISVTIFFSSINRYAINYAVGYGIFKAVGGKRLVGSISPIIMLVPVFFWKTTGAMIGLLLQNLLLCGVILFFIYKSGELNLSFGSSFKKLIDLLRSTGQLFTFSTLSHLSIHVVAPTILMIKEGVANLGLLTFAEDMRKFAQRTMNGAKVVAERKMYVEEGLTDQSNRIHSDYDKFLGTNFILYLLLNSILLGFTFICYRIITELFLTEFLPGIGVGLVLVISNMVFAASAIPNSFLISKERMKTLNFSVVFWLLLKIILILSFLSLGYGLMGVAFAVAISGCVYTTIVIVKSFEQANYSVFYGIWFVLRIILSSLILGLLLYSFLIWSPNFFNTDIFIEKLFIALIWALPAIFCFIILAIGIFILLFYDKNVLIELKNNSLLIYAKMREKFSK